jgi:hypothetical protein
VLSLEQLTQQRRPRGALPSLKQQYYKYQQDRIDGFKDSLSRDELMALGDEATAEMQAGGADQFVLTEILMLDMVDRLILRRLKFPSYPKWRKHYQPLRQAQREPVRWGIDPSAAIASLLPRIEPMDNVLIVGAGAQAEAFLLAAHDTEITFLDEDIGLVEQLETRMAGESLGSQFMAFVAVLGEWLPPLERELHLVVLDAGTLAALSHANRTALLLGVRNLTRPGGVHVIVPGSGPAAPEAYLSHYPDWDREAQPGNRRGRASRSRGVILTRPNQ